MPQESDKRPEVVELTDIYVEDRTGYATHVRVEVLMYGEHLYNANYSIPVRADGKAHMQYPGACQVFEVTAQAVISRRPEELEFLGAPVTMRARPGHFVESVSLVTLGELVPRTVVEATSSRFGRIEQGKTFISPMEITLSMFQYHDTTGEAQTLNLRLNGLQDGVPGVHNHTLQVHDNEADLSEISPPLEFSDVTDLQFEVMNASNRQIGNQVVEEASTGYYLTEVQAQSTRSGQTVVNSVTGSSQQQPIGGQSGGDVFELSDLLPVKTVDPHAPGARTEADRAPQEDPSRR